VGIVAQEGGASHLDYNPAVAMGKQGRLWICVALAGVVVLLYGQVAHHEFVTLDDRPYVYENPRVKGGLTAENVAWAFTAFHEGNWHPLTWLSHMVDAELWGLAPGPHHLTNVLLHALNAVLLFLALVVLTGATWRSALVAALFAVHPLRVESVAWVAERKDLLAGLFWILTLLAYAKYARSPSRGRFASVAALLALGLMAKPMLVTLPLVLLLLDVWPLGRWPEKTLAELAREKLPLLALSALSSVITAAAQKGGGAVLSLQKIEVGARVANALVSCGAYLLDTVYPARLAVLYPHPALVAAEWASSLFAAAIGAAVLLAGITWGVWRQGRRRPYLTVGWLWYLGTLVPVIGFVQVGIQARADRYTYLPLIGVYIVAAWGLGDLSKRWERSRPFLPAGVGAALAALASLTWLQIGTWRDSETLYRHALSVTRNNYLIHNNLAAVLDYEGKPEEAVEEYRRALRAKPNFSYAHFNLGVLLARQGDPQGARQEYELALRYRPSYIEAHNNLAAILSSLGDTAGAEEHYQAVLRIDPDFAVTLYNSGALMLKNGDLAGARAQLEAAVRVNPQDAQALSALATALQRQGDLEEATRRYEDTVRIDPGNFWAWYNLGVIAARKGVLPRATECFTRAIGSRPSDAQAHNALATVLARQRRYQEAEPHFQEAVRLSPDSTGAREGLLKVRRILGKAP